MGDRLGILGAVGHLFPVLRGKNLRFFSVFFRVSSGFAIGLQSFFFPPFFDPFYLRFLAYFETFFAFLTHFLIFKKIAPGEARTHGLQIMRLTRCLLRYRGCTDKLCNC